MRGNCWTVFTLLCLIYLLYTCAHSFATIHLPPQIKMSTMLFRWNRPSTLGNYIFKKMTFNYYNYSQSLKCIIMQIMVLLLSIIVQFNCDSVQTFFAASLHGCQGNMLKSYQCLQLCDCHKSAYLCVLISIKMRKCVSWRWPSRSVL